eukprot:jgi/Bigna1/73194/fgenesh1_pg.23_\
MAAQSENPPRPLRLIVREKDTIKFINPEDDDSKNKAKSWSCSEFPVVSSADGTKVAIPSADGVSVVNPFTEETLYKLAEKNVKRIQFSPKDTYIVTWRSRVQTDTNTGGNVAVFKAENGEEFRRFNQKSIDRWPTLGWSNDEKYAVQMVNNQLWLFEDHANRYTRKIDQTKVSHFSISPSGAYVAAGSPESNSKPGVLAIYTLPDFKATVSRSLFKCEEFELKWDPTGKYLLAQASVVSDQSGDSYYGEAHQYLVHGDGKFSQQLLFTNKGPIQDTQWAPDGKSFVIIQGHMPALASLYMPQKCAKKFEFGRAAWNTIRWSPHGRFLCLGGFGALQGHMHFWDAYKKKKIGVAHDREGPKYYDWSPDSRRFVTATVRPLRTVDNGYKIWSYAGELKKHLVINQLYQASYVTAVDGTYENKPQSPRLKGRKIQDFAAAKPVRAYVPPSLRGRAGGGLAAQLRKERAESGPTRIRNGQDGGKNNEKNRKKRERRRKKAAAASSATNGNAMAAASGATAASGEKKKSNPKPTGTTTTPSAAPPPSSEKKEPTEQEKVQKKIKSLKKKVRLYTI